MTAMVPTSRLRQVIEPRCADGAAAVVADFVSAPRASRSITVIGGDSINGQWNVFAPASLSLSTGRGRASLVNSELLVYEHVRRNVDAQDDGGSAAVGVGAAETDVAGEPAAKVEENTGALDGVQTLDQ